MDLNDFYQQHQIALMRAGAATCHGLHDRMLARAGGLAHDIARFQHVSGGIQPKLPTPLRIPSVGLQIAKNVFRKLQPFRAFFDPMAQSGKRP